MILLKLACTSFRSFKLYCLPRYFCEMGRRKGKWRNRQRGDRTDRDERGWMPTPVKENAAFVKYYQGLGLIPEGEWNQFLSKLKETLPVTFRITGYKGQAQELLKIIKGQYFTKFTDVVVDGNKVEPPRCLQWYPDGLAWQLDLAKRAIRGSDSLKRLHEFLVSETESGNISRQEAVSMIPPLLMDIKPDSKVLDMCAAPGSKTAQLIEYLHSSESTELPEGFVVANDSDNKRCYLMTHQVKRLQSPNCMIINHDATILPNLFLDSQESGRQSAVVYDRVLADVPCSGDGTFRKNQDLWRTWQPTVGASLHGLQLRIVRRGFELLGVGGRLVYSTCSLNPVEDEAVVAAIIRQTRGAVELVEAESMLPGLRCNKGVSSWKCMSRQGDWYEKFEDVPAKQKSVFKPTMFPPLPQYAHKYGLEKCLRVLPHHQDTGGFFIAVFKKTRALPWQKTFRFVDGVERTESSDEVASSSSVDEWWQHPGEKWDAGQGETTKQSHPACQGKTTMQSDCDTDTNNTSTSDSTKTACTNTETVNSESHPLKSNVSETEENLDKKLSESEQRQNADSESKMEVTSDQGENVTPEKIENESGPNEESEGNETNKAEKRPADSTEKSWPAKKPKMGGGGGYKEDPFFFLRESDIFWPPIKNFFGVSDSFPENQIMFRSVDGKRQNLYFVSENIKNIVQHNEDRVKFINLGVKIYGRSPSPLVPDCDYRLAQEGLAVMQKFSTCRRLLLSRDDLVTLLKEENPFLVKMSPEVQKQAAEITPGSTIFQYIPSESDAEPACEIVVCGWKGKTSLRSFVAKFERAHYLRLCGLELSDIQRQVAEKKAEKLSVKDGTKDNDGGKSPCEDKLEDNVDQGENPNDNANDSSTDIVNQNPSDDAVYPVAFDKPMGE